MALIEFQNNTSPYLNADNLNNNFNYLDENNKNLKGKILWVNPNPTNNISTETTITLSSNDYDVLEIYYKLFASTTDMDIKKVVKGFSTRLTVIGVGYYSMRRFIYNNDITYTIGIDSENASDRSIPLYIVGYKNDLFNN